MEAALIEILNSLAHSPWAFFALIFLFMYASSFGLPIPEEVTLLTVGFLVFMGRNPDLFPSPDAPETAINVHVAAWLCFIAVVSSDALVYALGRRLGPRILLLKPLCSVLNERRKAEIERWTKKLGHWAVGFFRFTPGIRFPGHLTCGMLGVPFHRFLLVDALAALVSVPTQVYLVAFYGSEILQLIRKYQPLVLAGVALFLVWHFRGTLLGLLQPTKKSPPATDGSE